jgi:hypothetical protein
MEADHRWRHVHHSQVTSLGDSYISGLAENIYTSLSVLAYEGEHEIVEVNSTTLQPEVHTIIDTRYVLNISGGESAWSSMDATIQAVDIDFMRGTTRIRFGPPKHIAPGDLEELLQWYRWRAHPVTRDNSQDPANGTTSTNAIGGDQKSENTSHDVTQPNLHVVAAVQSGSPAGNTFILHDAPNEQINIQRQNNSGVANTSYPRITGKLGDITSAGTTNQHAYFQVLQFYQVQSDGSCALMQACFLMTTPESV